MGVVEKICNQLAARLERRMIYRRDGKPYLARHYIFHSSRFKWLPGIYLHQFLSSDEDRELHNHPWGHAVSLILAGSYTEERREEDDSIMVRVFGPGGLNIIRANDFHRVDLNSLCVWTLFFSGNREQEWGFWDRDTGEYLHWEDHVELASKRNSDNLPRYH